MKSPHLFPPAIFWGLVIGAFVLSSGCGGVDGAAPPAASINQTPSQGEVDTSLLVSTDLSSAELSEPEFRGEEFPEVVLMTTKGKIRLKLNAKEAPATVDNFLTNYVATKHYDGTIFHYVQPSGMILGGLFDERMAPKPTRSEILNEATNGLKNVRGTIAMSRDPNFIHSSTCQFFINCADNTSFDHLGLEDSSSYGYCVFGEVVEGMDVVEAISRVSVKSSDGFVNLPEEPVQILSAERIK